MVVVIKAYGILAPPRKELGAEPIEGGTEWTTGVGDVLIRFSHQLSTWDVIKS